ncbi:MAG: hypothetical protein O2877_02900, partial [bacterium]|nr:hypothetical protein [bacterium]
RLLQSIKRTHGCAVADRFHKESVVSRSLRRSFVSKTWALLASRLLPCSFMDIQCGAKAMHKKHLADFLEQEPSGDWFFDTELIHFLNNNKISIERVSTEWVETRFRERKSTLPVSRTALKFILRLYQLKRHHRLR